MAFDIDSKIKNSETVTIGGKNYDVVFNDKFIKKLSALVLRFNKLKEKVTAVDDKKADEMSLDDQQKFIENSFDEAKSSAIDFFDEYLGKGEGQRIYEHFKKDTSALFLIVNELDKLSANKRVESSKNKRKKYLSNKR